MVRQWDVPACTCPVIAAFANRLYSGIDDPAVGTCILTPLRSKIADTATSDHDIMLKRGYIAADFAVREAFPIDMDLWGRHKDAAKLRALDPIVDRKSARCAENVLKIYDDDDDHLAEAATAAVDSVDPIVSATWAASAIGYVADSPRARKILYQPTIACLIRMCEAR